MRSLLFSAVIVGLVAAAPARADDLDKYLPANAGMYVHVNINRLLSADVIRKAIPMAFDKYGDQILPLFQLAKAFQPDLANLPEDELKKGIAELKNPKTIADAFDAAKDFVTDIIVAGDADDEEKFLVLVKVPAAVTPEVVDALTKLAEAVPQFKLKRHMQGKSTVYEIEVPEQPQSVFVAVPEAGVLCFGMKKEMVMDAVAGKKGGLNDKVKPLVAKRTPKDFLFVAIGGGKDANGIVSGSGSLVLDKDISGSVTFTYGNADKAKEAAKEMNESLTGFAEMLKGMLGDQAKDVTPVLEKMKANVTGMTVTGQFTVPGSVIEKLLAK